MHYRYLSGPFHDQFAAYDWIDAMKDLGELPDGEEFHVEGTTVYRRIEDDGDDDMAKQFATFETLPCVYDENEAWVYFDDAPAEWRKLGLAEILQFASPLTEAEFKARFPQLPAMPKAAFQAGE